MSDQLTWYEFFAGGGMARLGLGERWRCDFANEWCDKKAAAYTKRFGCGDPKICDELRIGDIAALTTADLPGNPDLAWASFPCQDLSLAGAGAGLSGQRSGTFKHFWKRIEGLAHENRAPRVVVLENVVGAITSHCGTDFAEILHRMCASDYSFGPLLLTRSVSSRSPDHGCLWWRFAMDLRLPLPASALAFPMNPINLPGQ